MKELTDRLAWGLVLAICIACVVALAVEQCSTQTEEPPPAELVKLYLHDTVYVDKPTQTEVIYVPVPEYVDTAAIIEEFFSMKVYADTIRPNEYVTITVTDTVYMNDLVRQNFDVVTVPKLVYTRRGGIGGGISVGKNIMQLRADLEIKKSNFSVGYDVINNSTIIGYNYKFKTW